MSGIRILTAPFRSIVGKEHERDPNIFHLCRVKDVDITEVMDTFSIFHTRRLFNENPLVFKLSGTLFGSRCLSGKSHLFSTKF